MVNAKGCAAGLMLGSILRAIVAVLSGIAKAVGAILWYTGLWVPALYALFGGVLYLVWKFNPFSGGLYETLYLVGFALCVVIFLIILVRNAVVRPFKSIAEGFRNPIWKKQDDESEKKGKKEKKEDEIPAWEQKREEKRRRKAIERGRKITEERARSHADSETYPEDESSLPRRSAERGSYYGSESSGDLDDIYGYRKTHSSRESEYDPFYDDPYAGDLRGAREEPKIYLSAVEADTLIHEYSDRFEVYDLDGGKKTLRSIEYKDGRR